MTDYNEYVQIGNITHSNLKQRNIYSENNIRDSEEK